jgi:nucleoside-diphosphate-sugar epimerase
LSYSLSATGACQPLNYSDPMPAISDEDLEHILAHTHDLWDEVRGCRIFITGGTGFFGCWLVESLLFANRRMSLGIETTVLSRDPAAFMRKCPHLAGDAALTLVKGDVRELSAGGEAFDLVIHAATESGAKEKPLVPLEVYSTVFDGTRRALEFALGCHAKKFLLTSSGAVYGTQPASLTHVSEEFLGGPDFLDPASAYAEGKRAAELMSVLYADAKLEVKIARCFAFVGPHLPLDAHFAIGNFIRDAMRGGPIVIAGDGTPRRSYLYAADLAIWLWTILFKGTANRAYNVGSEVDMSIAELARAVGEAIYPGVAVSVARQADPLVPVRRYVPSTLRAQQELGLRQHLSLNDAIRRTARWHGQTDRGPSQKR